MQGTNVWYQFYLQRIKIVFVLLLVLSASVSEAQKPRWARKNNPNYDDKKLTYGFLIGLHTSTYQIKYSDLFVTPALDTVHSVNPSWSSGFSLGFIVNYRLTEFLDLRLTPKVAFYEHSLTYTFTDDTPRKEELVETTMVEFPLLLKYKSERRGNIRMYMIGGINPGIEASGKNDEDENGNLQIKGANLSLEAGFGFDLYYPLFKFSPEIRFSRGISNLLNDATNDYGLPLKRVNTNTISVYLLFQ
jgi:hypothetical protein